MKQEEIIKQLKQLNKIEPRPDTIAEIKGNIFLQLRAEEKMHWGWLKRFSMPFTSQFKANSFMVYGSAIALVIFVFLLIGAGFLPNTANKIFLSVRIATAPNQYEKAKIAFSYTQAQIDALNKSNYKLDKHKLTEISRTIAFANTQLSRLKLMGEKGKYTSQQCQQLYKEYSQYLEKLNSLVSKKSIDGADEKSIELFKAQIAGYEKESEQKLNIY